MIRYLRYAAGWIMAHTMALPLLLLTGIRYLALGLTNAGQVIIDLIDFGAYDRRWSNRILDIAESIETWAKRP